MRVTILTGGGGVSLSPPKVEVAGIGMDLKSISLGTAGFFITIISDDGACRSFKTANGFINNTASIGDFNLYTPWIYIDGTQPMSSDQIEMMENLDQKDLIITIDCNWFYNDFHGNPRFTITGQNQSGGMLQSITVSFQAYRSSGLWAAMGSVVMTPKFYRETPHITLANYDGWAGLMSVNQS